MAEELFWIPGRFVARLMEEVPSGNLFKNFTDGLSKEAALGMFMLPQIASVIPILFSFWLIFHGHILLGIFSIILVRVLCIACSFKIFKECRNKLVLIKLFMDKFRLVIFNLRYIHQEIEKRPVYIKAKASLIARNRKIIEARNGVAIPTAKTKANGPKKKTGTR